MKRVIRLFFPKQHRGSEKGAILVLVLIIMSLMGMIMSFSLRGSMNDTHMVYRQLEYVQARGAAEGGVNIAKGDVLCQIAATNFLGGAFEDAQDKYGGIGTRFGNPSKRIPSNGVIGSDSWHNPSFQSLAAWNFADDPTLKLLPTGMQDWMVGSDMPSGAPRVYVSRSVIGAGSTATNAVASYDISLTGVSVAGGASILPVPAVTTVSFHHQLSYPQLFDYLMLGSTLSDCSFCHLKFWGDVGQVDAANPFQLHSPYNRANAHKLTLNGSLHLNSNFMRNNITTETSTDGVQNKNERMLATPGQNGQFIYAKNGGTLATTWAAENPSVPANQNPFRQISTLATPLPSSWPSVKENLLAWFEPRAAAQGSSGESQAKTKHRLDNNLSFTGWKTSTGATGAAVGSGSSIYNRAIDRVAVDSMMTATGGSNLAYDKGLHPADDLDGDTIPNGFDADIDGDGIPETPRASSNTSDAAYHLTSTTMASNLVFHAPTSKLQWQPGRQYVSGAWSRKATYQNDNKALINDTTRAWVYAQTGTGTGANYQWDAKVTGIAATMADLIDNAQATSTGQPTGTVVGVWPNAVLTGAGNPDYTQNGGKRNLVIVGSDKNPVEMKGQLVVRGDAVVQGTVDANQAVLVTHRNIYVPDNLKYLSSPNYDDPSSTAGNQLGLVSGANIVVGNAMHNSPTSAEHKDMMEFMWGNMISCNEPNVGSGDQFDGPGGGGGQWNHMINNVYLADGKDGGFWENGHWKTYNQGNLVTTVYNAQGMKVGGGLTNSGPYFESTRKHRNFTGSQYSGSLYKNFYISTPGLLPSGATEITSFPTAGFGTFSGSWFTSDDLKFFTLRPQDSAGKRTNALGNDLTVGNFKWINHVEAVLYADYGVVGGNIPDGNAGGKYMEFYGTVIGRDVQLLSARIGNTPTEAKYTKNIGGLYYDGRLKGAINPLGFPFEEQFIGGEMSMNGLPSPGGNRDGWVPFRLTQAYQDLHLF